MAAPPNVLIRFTGGLVDDESVRANIHQYVEMPNTATLADVQSEIAAFLGAIDTITDGVFKRAEAAAHFDPVADLSLAASKSGSEEASETGEFQYNLATTTVVWTLAVATLSESAVSGNNVNTGNAGVIALNNLLINPVLTSGFYCAPDGLAITTRKATFLGTRKHRRQQHAKSYKLG